MMKHANTFLAAGIAALFIALTMQAGSQTIRFVRESLAFTVAADSLRFSGVYYFDNPGPDTVRRTIFYPYVRKADPPDTTRIVRVSTEEAVTARNGNDGVSFEAVLPPFSTEAYRFAFAQRAPGRRFEYILTTTTAWDRPLERATIRIEIPAGLAAGDISLRPDSVVHSGSSTIYLIDRSGFMPDRELSITWKREMP